MRLNIVVTAHNEGDLLLETIASIENSVSLSQNIFQEDYLKIETFLLFDDPSTDTVNCLNKISAKWNYEINIFRDAALNRNSFLGKQKSNEDYLFFIDGDDKIGLNFVSQVSLFMQKSQELLTGNEIMHPKALVYFPNEPEYYVQENSINLNGRALNFVNYWAAPSLFRVDVLKKYPYKQTNWEKKRGVEDWSFNIDTYFSNISHMIIPNTVMFIRKRKDSRGGKEQAKSIRPHTSLALTEYLLNGK
jgi:hypothetical protein